MCVCITTTATTTNAACIGELCAQPLARRTSLYQEYISLKKKQGRGGGNKHPRDGGGHSADYKERMKMKKQKRRGIYVGVQTAGDAHAC